MRRRADYIEKLEDPKLCLGGAVRRQRELYDPRDSLWSYLLYLQSDVEYNFQILPLYMVRLKADDADGFRSFLYSLVAQIRRFFKKHSKCPKTTAKKHFEDTEAFSQYWY